MVSELLPQEQKLKEQIYLRDQNYKFKVQRLKISSARTKIKTANIFKRSKL